MHYYPIALDLRGRPCLVVGGGKIATRKIEGLLSAGGNLTVVSPEVTDVIEEHARQKNLLHLKRRYQEGDLKGYFLAFAATGVPEVDVLMAFEANTEGVLLNVVDRSALCGFIAPAVVQSGDLSIALNSVRPASCGMVKRRRSSAGHRPESNSCRSTCRLPKKRTQG